MDPAAAGLHYGIDYDDTHIHLSVHAPCASSDETLEAPMVAALAIPRALWRDLMASVEQMFVDDGITL